MCLQKKYIQANILYRPIYITRSLPLACRRLVLPSYTIWCDLRPGMAIARTGGHLERSKTNWTILTQTFQNQDRVYKKVFASLMIGFVGLYTFHVFLFSFLPIYLFALIYQLSMSQHHELHGKPNSIFAHVQFYIYIYTPSKWAGGGTNDRSQRCRRKRTQILVDSRGRVL